MRRTSSQRWRDRRERQASRALFEPDRHGVEPIDDTAARAFVCGHHYSGSYPAARLALGLYRYSGAARLKQLVGTMVYSVPCNQRVVPRYAPGCTAAEGIDLGRLVLLDEVEENGESWMLGQGKAYLRELLGEVRALTSYSDPCARFTLDGRTLTPGHVGIIYQATGAVYCGRSKPRKILISPDGRTVSERALSKIRLEEKGARGAERQLVALGCPPRHAGEDARAYVERASRALRVMRHPGNHVYGWALDKGVEIAGVDAPYPKKRDEVRTEGGLW